MSGLARLALVAGGLAVVVVLFVVLRGTSDEGESSGSGATTTAAGTTTSGTRPRTQPRAEPRPQPQPRPDAPAVIRIAFRDGRVAGGLKRETVEQGQRVVVAVSAFVDDHVHVHGYDLFDDVGPGEPARITFRATVPGRFEIELEERKLPIAELEVRP